MRGIKPMTATERVQEMRARRTAGGWKQLNVWLEPDAANCLQRMVERSVEIGKPLTVTDVINDALLRHFKVGESDER